MKRVLTCGAVALLFLVPAADATAQGKISGFLGVGPTSTAGDLKDADSTKSGFLAQGGFEYKFNQTIWFRFDVSMGWNDRLGSFAEDAYIWTFAGRLEYWLPFGTDKIRPYANVGGGILTYKRNPGETGLEDTEPFTTKHRLMASGGLGLDYQLGNASIFVEGRYDMAMKKSDETGSGRTYIPILIGGRWGGR
ncbi:MAG: outer membrane beta-barrel protein [Gemmatimonadaceae bacterium]|nr:outer membrane beta-barrel protein [Gemmatimonadaceae bacterium]